MCACIGCWSPNFSSFLCRNVMKCVYVRCYCSFHFVSSLISPGYDFDVCDVRTIFVIVLCRHFAFPSHQIALSPYRTTITMKYGWFFLWWVRWDGVKISTTWDTIEQTNIERQPTSIIIRTFFYYFFDIPSPAFTLYIYIYYFNKTTSILN